MSDKEPCKSKARIDKEAKHAIGDISSVLKALKADKTLKGKKKLQLELEEAKEHLRVIAQDRHTCE